VRDPQIGSRAAQTRRKIKRGKHGKPGQRSGVNGYVKGVGQKVTARNSTKTGVWPGESVGHK